MDQPSEQTNIDLKTDKIYNFKKEACKKGAKNIMFSSGLNTKAELILVCRVNPTFNVNKKLKTSLQRILQNSVDYFDFGQAGFFLVREGRPPVWWEAAKEKQAPQNKIKSERRQQLCNYLAAAKNNKKQKMLEPFNPVLTTTLPVILRAGKPVGTMEIGIFNTDLQNAQYMLVKAVSLGRHIADTIQESLFENHKGPHFKKLAVWMEMVNTISSTLDIRQVLHVVAQLTADLFSAKSCIYLLDKGDQTLIPAVAVGSYDPELRKKFKALRGTRPFPAITRVIETRQPVSVTPQNMHLLLTPEIIKNFDYGWLVLAPILVEGKTIGIMQVDRPKEAAGFDAEENEIIFAITRATAIAMENARLIEKLEQKEQLLHQLVNKAITAQEDERKRLAADLHDGIIQSLIAIWYRLQRIKPVPETDPEKWYTEIAELTKLLSGQIQDIRRILYDLRPLILDNYGLVPAVEYYVHNLQEKHNLPIEIVTGGENRRLASKIEVTLFRILQEALTNVIKHAQATQVKVRLEITANEATLEVADNGTGLDMALLAVGPAHNRLGLASIQERALLLGGSCVIDSQPAKGTHITVKIPLES